MGVISIHELHKLGLNEPDVEIPPGDAKKGSAVFKKKCASCHTTNEGGKLRLYGPLAVVLVYRRGLFFRTRSWWNFYLALY